MLRRHSTRSKTDLQRRKSAASVRSVQLEHISAAAAERDAKLAAVHAFSRGHDRHSADMAAMFPPKQPSPSQRDSRSPISQVKRTDSTTSDHEEGGLGRRQSVRFVGPDSALQTRASKISMHTIAPEREQDPASAVARGSVRRSQSSQQIGIGRHSVLRDSQNIPLPDRTSSRGKALQTPKSALKKEYLQALMPNHQQYTPEDDIASMPSSFRKVRKTRSMFVTRDPVRTSQDTTSFASETTPQAASTKAWPRFSFLNRKENDPRPSTPTLKALRSTNFLRHRKDPRKDRTSTSTADQDPAYDQSPTLDPTESSVRSRILPKSSMFFGPKAHRLAPGMRKSLKNSASIAALPVSGTTASISMSIHGSMRVKARKVSSSIRSRFKNLFISKSEDDAGFPAQQIEAQRSHVTDLFDVNHFGPAASDTEHYHVHETSSLSRVPSRLPALHSVPSNERLRSRSGSIDSFRSADRRVSDETSRVTSWASTEANTVIAQRTEESSEDWDRQRLSVITEHGLHDPSASLPRPKPALQTITSQEELAPPTIFERLAPGTAVDSQRVYSALMKRMSNTQQLLDDVRNSSDGSDPFRTLSPPTSDESSDNGEPMLGLGPPKFGSDSGTHSSFKECLPERNPARLSTRLEIANGSDMTTEDHRPLSPPIHLTPKGAEKPFTDRSSAFFGSPTSHLFRTRSPWRKSLQDAINNDRGLSQELPVKPSESLAATTGHEMSDRKADSASNYSQDTQIHKFEMRQEYPVTGLSQAISGPGYATVYGDGPLSYRPRGERIVSTASSVDWKKRLSYDVAEMERSLPSPTRVTGRPSEVEYIIPTMPRAFGHGHVREPAQIGSCEEDEYDASPAVHVPTNPTTPLELIEPNIIRLTPQQRSVMQTTPPSTSETREHEHLPSKTSVSLGDDGMSYIVPKDALRPRASPLSSGGSRSNSFQTAPQEPRPAIRQARSYNTVGRMRAEETGSPRRGSPTVRLMRKTAARLEGAGSPGFSTAFERHFGSLPKRMGEAKENQSPARDDANDDQGERSDGHQQIRGSKTMVDLFLSSRRRQRRSGEGASFL